MEDEKTYRFSELSEEAKKHALQYWRDKGFDVEVPFSDNDGHEELTKEKGFTGIKLQYSLGNCQGDGLSFSADYEHDFKLKLVNKYLGPGKEKTAALLADYLIVHVKGNTGNHYCYASRSDVEVEVDYGGLTQANVYDKLMELSENIQSDIADDYMDLCKQLEKEGYEHYEHLDSDEYLGEFFEINDYLFYEAGERV